MKIPELAKLEDCGYPKQGKSFGQVLCTDCSKLKGFMTFLSCFNHKNSDTRYN